MLRWEHTRMIPANPAQRRSRCSPHPLPIRAMGWAQRTGVNSAEGSSKDTAYQSLTCRNCVLAGQQGRPDNVFWTRKRSLVRSQYRPPKPQVRALISVY
jgi:hypothetical protein